MILHAEKGLLGTSFEEIASRADVAPATVYRHFPSLTELIPACVKSIFDLVKPPTLDQASEMFADLTSPAARCERLIRESCLCYRRGAGWLHAARCEAHLIPAIGEAVRMMDSSLATLVRAALRGEKVSRQTERLLVALINFPFWKALIDTGMSRKEAEDLIAQLVHDQLGNAEVS
jgi:AcrR family transcriptional regulator